MTRAYKAYESANQYIETISSRRNNFLTDENLNSLMRYIKEYIEAFASKATGVNYFKNYDMEFVRLINYLLRFGLFIYLQKGNNQFQSKDIDFVFSYLSHI